MKGYRWNEGKEEAYVISEMAVDFPKAYGDGVLISLFLQYLTSGCSPECNCSASLRCTSPRGSLFSGSLHLKDKAQVTKQDDIKLSHVLSRVPSLSLTPAPTSLHLQSYTFCFNNMQFVTFSMSPHFRTTLFPLFECPFLVPFYRPFVTQLATLLLSFPTCWERWNPLTQILVPSRAIRNISHASLTHLAHFFIHSLKPFQDFGQHQEHNRHFMQVCGCNNTWMKKF